MSGSKAASKSASKTKAKTTSVNSGSGSVNGTGGGGGDEAPERAEYIKLSTDAVFDPRTAFHMEVQWVVATAQIVVDWTRVLERKAKAANLTLLRVPCVQPLRTADPWHAPVVCK
jgi:hypothetical protein